MEATCEVRGRIAVPTTPQTLPPVEEHAEHHNPTGPPNCVPPAMCTDKSVAKGHSTILSRYSVPHLLRQGVFITTGPSSRGTCLEACFDHHCSAKADPTRATLVRHDA